MKTIAILISLFAVSGSLASAQSTTGGKSGGSTASTGTGYLTEGQRPSTSNPNSMTIDDEGASRAYMYVPPTAPKNRAASPSGPDRPNITPDSLRKQSSTPRPKQNNR